MSTPLKQEVVASINEALSTANTVVVTHYQGLTVPEVVALRRKMRQVGASFRITKNTLTKRALKGTQFEPLAHLFSGPTAIAYSKDAVAAAKAVVEFAKDNEKLVILGGAINDQVIDVAGVKSLASLPSLDELRAKILSVINAPATKVVGVVQAPAGQLVRVIQAYSEKSEG